MGTGSSLASHPTSTSFRSHPAPEGVFTFWRRQTSTLNLNPNPAQTAPSPSIPMTSATAEPSPTTPDGQIFKSREPSVNNENIQPNTPLGGGDETL
jgi:hypothetical protein